MQRISFVIIVHIIAYLSCFLKLLGSIKFVNHWLWRSACAFFQPAYAATFPALLPRPYLPGANAFSSLSTDVTGIIGPGLDATSLRVGDHRLHSGSMRSRFSSPRHVSSLCLEVNSNSI